MSFWESELRFYVAPLLTLAGLAWAAMGVRRRFLALRLPLAVCGKNVSLMSGFRAAVVGAAIACVAFGWLLHSVALVAAAAIIGAGELLETSLDLWALRQETWSYSAASRPRSASRSGMAEKV